MTCFVVTIAYPNETFTPRMRLVNERRLHLLLHTWKPYDFVVNPDAPNEYFFQVCDEGAVRFVSDIPQPFFVKSIQYRHSPFYLFYNRFMWKHQNFTFVKPTSKTQKDLFWAAKATERWTPRE